jgi:hypothetical protein
MGVTGDHGIALGVAAGSDSSLDHGGRGGQGGFWSISVYNAEGFFEPNEEVRAYSINNITAVHNDDGSVTIRFGDEGGNSLPITALELPPPPLPPMPRNP